jgi:hypothetical protein
MEHEAKNLGRVLLRLLTFSIIIFQHYEIFYGLENTTNDFQVIS